MHHFDCQIYMKTLAVKTQLWVTLHKVYNVSPNLFGYNEDVCIIQVTHSLMGDTSVVCVCVSYSHK